MQTSKTTYDQATDPSSSVVREDHIEYGFIGTNRVLNSTKPFGNILDFRQQQDAVDTAIALFAGEKTTDQAREIWLVDGILQRMIFDGEHLSDLMAPLDLGWKARTQAELALMADQLFKDPFLFDFLGTADPRREAEVEQALVDHIQKFLLELGTGFAFVGRQVRLEVGGEDYPLDLLFYHLKLRRYVVIELKTKITAPQEEATPTLVPKLRFPEFRKAEGWKETQLQKIARPVTDRAVTGDGDNILSLSGEHGLVLQNDYFGKKVAGDSAERYLKLFRNDFVYNDRTTKASTFGTIKRLSKYPGGIVSPIYKCFRFHADENPIFWEWYFESGRHDASLGGLVNEGARAGRFNISITQFLSTAALRPDKPEQQKIATCLSSLDELIAAQARKVDALKTHKKGLMQQLFPAPTAQPHTSEGCNPGKGQRPGFPSPEEEAV